MNKIKNKDKDKAIKNIYKYIKLEHLISTIENGLYMAPAEVLNDPFEYINLKHSCKFYIGCLTSSFNNKIMWSIYANSHKGCVVQFSIDDLPNKSDFIRRVDYVNYTYKNRTILNKNETYELLFCKDKKWNSENEIRVIYDVTKNNDKYKQNWNFDNKNNIYLKATVKRVYLGCASEKDNEYKKILYYLYSKNIDFEKMKLSDKNFRILIDRELKE